MGIMASMLLKQKGIISIYTAHLIHTNNSEKLRHKRHKRRNTPEGIYSRYITKNEYLENCNPAAIHHDGCIKKNADC